MSHQIRPTRPSMGGFGLRVVERNADTMHFYASIDRLAKALAESIDAEMVWGVDENRRVRVKSRPDHALSLCDGGTCLQATASFEAHVQVEASPAKCAHFALRAMRSTAHYEASDPFGKLLPMATLLARGRVLVERKERTRYRYLSRWKFPVYCGVGPVPGVRKWRGGRRCMRRMKTTGEQRLNALVLREEGEVAVRAARNAHNLPSSWDDHLIQRECSWKSQHKGAKSWDRARVLSKSLKAKNAQKAFSSSSAHAAPHGMTS